MTSYRLDLAWEGTAYHGWQIQPNHDTIQRRVELALKRIFNGENIRVNAAGRTDAGVHALQQIISFKSNIVRNEKDVLRGLNGLLPKDIACISVKQVNDDFQARYATKEKMYRYRLLLSEQRCPFRRNHTWYYRPALDINLMKLACLDLQGTHDYGGFRAKGCSAKHTWRTIRSCEVHERDDELHFEAIGNGFLRHQIRIMVGTLLLIGTGKNEIGLINKILTEKDRSLAGQTVPACGLWLMWTNLKE
jgi:tRNA pseudouridine38-40 synthase